MRPDMRGWEPAGLAAEGWISPARSAAFFVRRLVFPSSYLREARLPAAVVFLCYSGITTHAATSGKAYAAHLKKRDLDVQELLRILPEIPDQQPPVPGQSRQVVVQLRVGEKFARRRRVVTQLGGRARQIRTRIAQLVVKSIVRGQFP